MGQLNGAAFATSDLTVIGDNDRSVPNDRLI
jgi:hypothetical protein